MTDPATTCVTQKEANLDDFVHIFSLLYKVRGVKPCVVLIRACLCLRRLNQNIQQSVKTKLCSPPPFSDAHLTERLIRLLSALQVQ